MTRTTEQPEVVVIVKIVIVEWEHQQLADIEEVVTSDTTIIESAESNL